MALISYLIIVALMVTLSSSSVVKAPSNGTFELLILHNNDMHARFEQTSQLSGTCTTEDRDAGKCYGGFPRVATLVKEARAAAASGQGPPVLYLNAGDTYTGTAWFTIYKWKVAAEFLNAIQPDAVSPANDDFDSGTKLSPLLENLGCTILASNIVVNNYANKQIIQKSTVKTMGDIKIGIIGYHTPNTESGNTADKILYGDEILAIKEEVEKLKSQGVKIIIALGNSERKRDIEIATEVDDIDLVIAGHKNVYLWNGANAESNSEIEDQIIVTQKSGKRVPVIKSFAYNENLGQVALKFNSEGEIVNYEINKVLLDTSIPQDAGIFQIVNKLRSDIIASSDAVIGNTTVVLDGESCGLEECNLGNLIADSVMYYYAVRYQGVRWTDAPIAVIQAGAIATSIAPTNRPAGVTTNNLLAAIPSQNNVVTVTMNGTILLQMLEHSVADYRENNPSRQFLQLSGIRVTYDLAKDRGSRIVNAMARCWDCSIPEFYSIDDWREYKILMPAALAEGQLGYSMLVGLPRQIQDFNEATCTAEYIRLRSPVYPEVAGRLALLNTGSAPGSATQLHTSTFLFAILIMYSIMTITKMSS